MPINRLSDRLREKMQSNYGQENVAWAKFATDNKFFLRQRSKRVKMRMLDMVPYKYRPHEYYAAQGGDVNQTWIFLMVNDIRNAQDFNESVTSLWIPSPDDIKELKREYDSSASARAGTS